MSFRFKRFAVNDSHCAMKVGTDSVLLGAWVAVDGVRAALDAGAGSGLLALMVAQRQPLATVTAVELDSDATADCRANFEASPWADRLHGVCGDFAATVPDRPVDLLISNPPFFTETLQSPRAARATARHAAGSLSPLTLIDYAARHLSAGGTLAMIAPTAMDSDITFAAELAHLAISRQTHVVTRPGTPPSRTLWQIARTDGVGNEAAQPASGTLTPYCHDTITLRNPDGTWTDAYLQLTADFYLRPPGT